MNALEFSNVSSNDLSVVNDVIVLAALVDQQEIIIHAVLLLVVVSTNHHIECDVVWIVLVVLEIIQLDLCICHPFLSLLELSVVNLLQILELLVNILQVLQQNSFSGLLLNNQNVPHFLKLLLERLPQLVLLLFEVNAK